jgi:hypothetical protein
MEHKRKLVRQHQPSSSSRQRVATPSAGPAFYPAQPLFQLKIHAVGQGYSTPQRQVIQCHNNFQAPTAGNQSVQRNQATQNTLQGEWKCYDCGEQDHFASQCPNTRNRPPQTAVSTPTPTRGANFVLVAARQNYVHGKVISSITNCINGYMPPDQLVQDHILCPK